MGRMFLSEDGNIWKGILAISKIILIVLKFCLPSRFREHVFMTTILNAGLKKYFICLSTFTASWVEFLLQRPN